MKVERPLPADGQAARITELFVWTSVDPMTDVEGVLAWRMPQGGAIPLVSSMRSMAERMGPVVDEMMRSAEEPRPVARLRRFVPAEES